ncbi:TrbI/VirB10 family protein [Cognatishimia sp. D5M38]|uniref:TrbI/VirB10 family protein n=1 Tax=Cognatishimia coralii TaxID=3083254 RepID=A0ABU8QKS1_9RHOB
MVRKIRNFAFVGLFGVAFVAFMASFASDQLKTLASKSWIVRQEQQFDGAVGEDTNLADQVESKSTGVTDDANDPVENQQGRRPTNTRTTVSTSTTQREAPAPTLSDEQLELIEAIRLETLQAEAEERQHRRQRERMAGEAPLGNSLYTLTPQPVALNASQGLSPVENVVTPNGITSSLSAPLLGNQSIQIPSSQSPIVPTAPVLQVPPQVTAASVEPATSIQPHKDRPVQPAGTQALERGTFISAAMLTELRSELPGLVRAMVTDPVYDSRTGHYEMIPRGSLLIGQYNTETAPGQSRLLVAWDEIQFPDGRIVPLDHQGAVDAKGASGVTGKRQTGFLTTVLTGALVNLAANAGRSQGSSSDLSALAGQALGQSVSNVTQDYMGARLARGPRFTIKSGQVVNVLLDKPLYLQGKRLY